MPAYWRIAAATVLLAITGCSEVTAPAGSCAALLNIDGVMYTKDNGSVASAAVVSSGAVGEVNALRECVDVNPKEGDNVLLPGESNFLPAGTTIHSVEGFTSQERLAYRLDTEDVWYILVPLPDL